MGLVKPKAGKKLHGSDLNSVATEHCKNEKQPVNSSSLWNDTQVKVNMIEFVVLCFRYFVMLLS